MAEPVKVRIAGTDNTRGVVRPNLTQVQQPENRGMQYRQQASQSINAAYDGTAATTKYIAEIGNSVTQNSIASNRAVGEALVNSARISSSKPDYASQAMASIAGTLGNIGQLQQREKEFEYEQQQKQIALDEKAEEKRLKEQEAMQQRQQQLKESLRGHMKERAETYEKEAAKTRKDNAAVVQWELHDLVSRAPEIINKENGEAYYRSLVMGKIFSKDIDAEDRQRLMNFALEPRNQVLSQNRQRTQEEIDKITAFGGDVEVSKLNLSMAGVAAAVKYNNLPISEGLKALNGYIGEFAASGKVDTLTVLELTKAGYEQLLPAAQGNFEQQEEAKAAIGDINSFMSEFSPIYAARRAGTMTAPEFEAEVGRLASKYPNVPEGVVSKVSDYQAPERERLQQLDIQDKLVDFQSQGYLKHINSLPMSQAWVGATASKIMYDESLIKTMESNPELMKVDRMRFVVEKAKEWRRYNADKTEVAKQINQIELDRNAWNSATVRMFTEGATVNSLADFFQTLDRFGTPIDPAMAQQRVQNSASQAELQQTLVQIRAEGERNLLQKAAILRNGLAQKEAELAPYGLVGDKNTMDAFFKKYDGDIKSAQQQMDAIQTQQLQQPEGARPNFNQGSTSPTAFTRIPYKGQQLLLPFKAGTKAQISDDYGDLNSPVGRRRGRPHAGMDIAVPIGTPVTATGHGTVVLTQRQPGKGYGNFMDVKYSDGSIQRFAHLQGFYAKPGDTVYAGQVIAKTGDTGSPGEAHLHWEFRKSSSGRFENSLDPFFASANLVNKVSTVRPKSDTRSWDNSFNPYLGGNPRNIKALIPKNAVPLAGGFYLLDNKVYQVQPKGSTVSNKKYSSANPLPNTVMPSSTKNYKKASPQDNYGYAKVARTPGLSEGIARVANKHGFPGHWLADLMAVETRGTFSTQIHNGAGYYGLIQFGADARKDLGVTLAQLTSMNEAQQMNVVDKYLTMMSSRAGTKIDSPEKLVAAVWGGSGLLSRIAKGGSLEGVKDFLGTSGRKYLAMMGQHSGRNYLNKQENRRSQVATVVHSKPRSGCKTCNALTAANTFLIHEAQT